MISQLCVSPVSGGDFNEFEQMGIRSIASALVTCGEDEASIRRAVIDQTFGFFLDLFRRCTQHELEGVEIALQTNLVAKAFLDFGNIHISARRFLERFHDVDVALLGHHFHYFTGTTANMQMREDPIALAYLGSFLDKGQIILTKVFRATDAQTGRGTT